MPTKAPETKKRDSLVTAKAPGTLEGRGCKTSKTLEGKRHQGGTRPRR